MAEREKNPVQVLSPLVFSEALCHGNHKIDSYLRKINNHVRRRTGFELAPFAKELALEHLAKYGSEESRAIQATLRSLPAGPYFPGIKGPFRYEEQCIFVRTLAETAKNFGYIARHVLPGRTTFELVWLYFARHKQLWLQNGGLKDGQILDDGGEKLKRVPLTTERTISALRSLAITAADGFPIDNRALQAITAVRRGILQREKKRRDDESIRHRTRLRNGFELPGVYRS